MDAKRLQRLGSLTVVLVLLVPFGIALWNLHRHPDLEQSEHEWLAPGQPEPRASGLNLMWLGAAGVYISDGETSLLIDGYFSRPSLSQLLLGQLAPDPGRIRDALKRAGIRDLDAVVVTHAHHDHALDAPWIAAHYDAHLLGSPSAANVARGQGLAEALIREIQGGRTIQLGRFRLRFPRSRHLPLPPMLARLLGADETLDEPLTVPARLSAWPEGQTRAVHLSHPRGNVVVQASAGFQPRALAGLRADLALVSVFGLGKQSAAYRADYAEHAVKALRPEWVIPIHWDDLTRPITETTPPFPLLLENIPLSLQSLSKKLQDSGARMRLVRPFWRLHLRASESGVELSHVPSA